jgi:hypothetical protein
MKTLLLDRTYWDLCIDSNGNIAMAAEPYAIAQDAASAIKLFLGEYWYDTTIGIPYFREVLGYPPSVPLMESLCRAAAMTVPDVVKVLVFFTSLANGQASGQVQITDINGNTSAAHF